MADIVGTLLGAAGFKEEPAAVEQMQPLESNATNSENNASSENTEDAQEEEEEESEVEEQKVEEKSEKKKRAPVKREKKIPIPKNSATFFRARAKFPSMFKFTADGNLQVPEMRGEAAKVIEIPSYRPSLPDEIKEAEAVRRNELILIEKEYDETLQALKNAMAVWRETHSSTGVIKYQRELTRLDTVRSQLRSPLRWTKEYKRLSIRQLFPDEFYQVKKIGHSSYAMKLRSIAFEDMTKIGELVTPTIVEPTEEEPEEEVTFIFFSDPTEPKHGPLSPDTMVEFIFNSTKYNSLIQAYELERITQLGRRTQFGPSILKSRSPAFIRSVAARVTGEVENPRALWIDILKALVAQHPRYNQILRDTGSDTLVYADPKEGRWGIGMSANDPLATDKNEWKGPNILGQAWQVVRDSLPEVDEVEEEEEAAPMQGGGFTEHGKTVGEAKDQRTRVLQGYYRRGGGGSSGGNHF
jgi:predicted NAD-dependent protein-ADP-ribosyltransferase YbiA (DUF1768 family)